MSRIHFHLVLGFLLATSLYAQLDPEGAQVISYFPQLTDGGPPSQQWITSLTFVNAHQMYTAAGTVYLYNNNGDPLALDFGNGAVSSFTFSIPPQGTVSFTSKGTSPAIVTGWAIAYSTLPLEGVIQFRYSINGVPQQGVSATATEASREFRSPATTATGVAVANVNSSGSVPIAISAIDANGTILANSSLTLSAHAHSSFTVGQVFPNLTGNFHGTILIQAPATYFVAWTLSSDLGTLASYPASGDSWPVSQYERIWKVWWKVLNVAVNTFPLGTPPTLVIDPSTSQINSFADPGGNDVHIFMNLAELISDSESELSFAIGHELGHIIQARIGKLAFVPSNKEYDADEYGMLLSLVAGYDPYGGAGALAKLAMASGQAGLLDQNFDNLEAAVGADLHGSFDSRLALIFQEMQQICAMPQYQGFCETYKSDVHPHLPASAPLDRQAGNPRKANRW